MPTITSSWALGSDAVWGSVTICWIQDWHGRLRVRRQAVLGRDPVRTSAASDFRARWAGVRSLRLTTWPNREFSPCLVVYCSWQYLLDHLTREWLLIMPVLLLRRFRDCHLFQIDFLHVSDDATAVVGHVVHDNGHSPRSGTEASRYLDHNQLAKLWQWNRIYEQSKRLTVYCI